MTAPGRFGYAFAVSLPPLRDEALRRWAEATPGATWDRAGAHVTVARFTGDLPSRELVPLFQEACAGVPPIEARFSTPHREEYWDKPGLEIVMLTAAEAEDVADIMALRERLLTTFLPRGLRLMEGGDYRPHITLTLGLPSQDAERLERSASNLQVSFTAHEVVYWSGGETSEEGTAPDPPWRPVERLLLL